TRVFEPSLKFSGSDITPNPDVWRKSGLFPWLSISSLMGIRAGYYANKVWKDHNDVTKDQTYDLSVPECGLSRALF
ncbi:hypothetical protein BD769DRAFT_1305801, partial [Suillus cothurnatus]